MFIFTGCGKQGWNGKWDSDSGDGILSVSSSFSPAPQVVMHHHHHHQLPSENVAPKKPQHVTFQLRHRRSYSVHGGIIAHQRNQGALNAKMRFVPYTKEQTLGESSLYNEHDTTTNYQRLHGNDHYKDISDAEDISNFSVSQVVSQHVNNNSSINHKKKHNWHESVSRQRIKRDYDREKRKHIKADMPQYLKQKKKSHSSGRHKTKKSKKIFFDEEESPTNITILNGQTALLTCLIRNVGNKTVSSLMCLYFYIILFLTKLCDNLVYF